MANNMAEYDQAITAFYAQMAQYQGEPGLSRLQRISGYFLGRPYLLGALGEGENGRFDQSPVYRTDAFDCLTYVNTVLALFYADNLPDFQRNMARFNYRDGVIAYQNRHHFMEVDWNPGNARLGIVSDITQQIVDTQHKPIALTAQALIDRPNWFAHRDSDEIKLLQKIDDQQMQARWQEMKNLGAAMQAEPAKLLYLPLSRLFDTEKHPDFYLFNQIPSGAIIEIVRPTWQLRDKIGTDLLISHVGFAFAAEDGLIFREASQLANQVIDVPLTDYLQTYLDHPTIKGIHIEMPQFNRGKH